MTESPNEVLVGIPEIAAVAGVGRSAVGNWRKRYPDFPASRLQTPTGAMFDLVEVERWLIENGKISAPIPREAVLWQFADGLRGSWRPQQMGAFLIAALVYLEACHRAEKSAETSDRPIAVDLQDRWAAVRQEDDRRLVARLIASSERIEQSNTTLTGLLAAGLNQSPRPDPQLLRLVLDTLNDAAADEVSPRWDLFEGVISRVQTADRFHGEFSTPSSLTHLLFSLGEPYNGTVFDPASGEGGTLLMAAVSRSVDEEPIELVGVDINADVLNVSRARFFLYGFDADLRMGDVFRMPIDELPKADVVLLDPPLGQRNWGDADIYLADRWPFGVPPPASSDLAWVQLAVQCLKPNGRAFVVLPPGAAERSGREATIRSAMLEAGVIEAVVLLPPRLRTETSIPLMVWVLRPPAGAPRREILMIDASAFGSSGRSQYSLDEDDIDEVVSIVHNWQRAGTIADSAREIAWSVATKDIEDADLTPLRYRPTREIDVLALEARASDLRGRLGVSIEKADQAVRWVLDRAESR